MCLIAEEKKRIPRTVRGWGSFFFFGASRSAKALEILDKLYPVGIEPGMGLCDDFAVTPLMEHGQQPFQNFNGGKR